MTTPGRESSGGLGGTGGPGGLGGSRIIEAGATAVAGAVLAAVVGRPIGMGRAAAVVGGANGLVSGWRGIYDWRSGRGVAAFVLDSTWGLASTAGSLGSHVIAVVRGRPGYAPHLSEREDRHVYERGFQPRAGFLITVGNVVSGAGDTSTPRRQRLVRHHEHEHVWQGRLLGPFYPPLYAAWMAAGAAVGVLVWATRSRDQPLFRVVETYAYYMNPFEWWAYSRDDSWPPGRMAPGLGWRRPMVRAIAVPRPVRATGRTPAAPR